MKKLLTMLWLPAGIVILLAAPLVLFLPDHPLPTADPASFLPQRAAHVDHSALMPGPYSSPQAVTERCLECHQQAGDQVLHSSHWTWEHEAVPIEGRAEPVKGGKKNVINNFCIGIGGNWEGCSSCHAGYGWKDNNFDFSKRNNIDCVVCHEQTGTYVKGKAGIPVEAVDLTAVAQSVASPSRSNCGSCHFGGGGGDAVKHGDLDSSLYFPSDDVDVHMGKHNMVCTDCHRTENHNISGRSLSVSLDNSNQIACTDCHASNQHKDQRINQHSAAVACQTCHIPEVATRIATKTHWDWSQAGDASRTEGTTYQKKKGEFSYTENLAPNYFWYNGLSQRYLYGDKINSQGATDLNFPTGDISDNKAKIFPFKVHRAKQIYDLNLQHLLQPKTYGETGYWQTFDWDNAVRQGSEAIGLAYSGEYGFTETRMYWPQTHMVQAARNALQCRDCHNESANDAAGRLDWQALGYFGDPIRWGSRKLETEK
ncbi:tetrathionate reductase family octaheme c-type cytochrome [Teredinibacter franksiae]|uniref:tetrathionate reductase family octaheme c-type cytochrome n=1 Tax=Teredinibacter franksiae TaxID=2761453 RepID=UPI001C8A32FF|nr:tetrathionate reductase family octaheme c-type cytochrome [Teredinibacter franksiae]